ncbi:MAG: sialidase family protein, partial [Bacteroidota bacterium]
MKRSLLLFTIIVVAFCLISHSPSAWGQSPLLVPKSGFVETPAIDLSRIQSQGNGIQGLAVIHGANLQANQDTGRQPQNETSIATNPLDILNLVGGANDYRENGGGDAGYYYSLDGGRTWRDGILPNVKPTPNTFAASSGDPALAFDASGNVYYSYIWFERASYRNGIFVNRSTNGGQTWKTFPDTVIVHLENV